MRFSKRKYPLLFQKFKEYTVSTGYVNSLSEALNITKEKALEMSFSSKTMNDLKSRFIRCVQSNSVYYVSNTFIQDAIESSSAFTDKSGHYSGKYIDEIIEHPPICFFDKQGLIFLGEKNGVYVFSGKYLVATIAFLDQRATVVYCKDAFQEKDDNKSLLSSYLNIVLFKKYAKLKEKVLPPKKKIKSFHCKYKSDLPFSVGLLNENWYTESVQAHPFMVRGHWRWQACGERWSKRELTWVNPHQRRKDSKGPYKEKN